jgi:hypothetical protein
MTELAQDAILGVILSNPETAAEVFAQIPVEAFTGDRTLIAQAINAVRLDRKIVDPVTVSLEMRRRGTLSRIGAHVPTKLATDHGFAKPALQAYVDEVVREVRLRDVYRVSAHVAGLTEALEADPLILAQRLVMGGQKVLDHAAASAEVFTPDLEEFLAVEEAEYDWVVPGLLERGDRLILTGSEGLGKSTLFRQIAVCIAAGVHPFTGKPMPPHRALIVDCENGPTHMRRKLRPLEVQSRIQGQGSGHTLFVESRPEGLNLLDPAHAQWLVSRVSTLQPSIMFTGSLYKLIEGDPNKEEPARAVAAVLDRCRAVANCAVVVEAHSGHSQDGAGKRNVRPIGASLWLRWPEFGYGLRPTSDFNPATRVVDFVSWRGDRDERNWPKRLKAGSRWPWEEAADPDAWGVA